MAANEMQITTDDLRNWPFLHRIAGLWNVVLGMYDQADPLAMLKQEEHRGLVERAALCATAAVCVAIGELSVMAISSLAPILPGWAAIVVIFVSIVCAVILGSGAVWFFRQAKRSSYNNADRSQRRRHRWYVNGTALCSTAAVGIFLLGFAALRADHWRLALAIILTLTELLLVWVANQAFEKGEKAREEWLRQRNRAERCRLLSFRSLMRTSVWESYDRQPVPFAKEDEAEIKAIGSTDFPAVEEWLEKDEIPPPPGRFHPANKDELLKLRNYYLQKRLGVQQEHFKTRKSEAEIARDRTWRELPGAFFWASIVFVGLHAAGEMGWLFSKWKWAIEEGTRAGCVERVLIGLVTLAALAPTVAAGIHTSRSAWERTRNISRFRAKSIALGNIEARLNKSKESLEDEDAEELIRDIWCAEQIMESEHREWLRLMKDAEWAG